jgi:PAS domain S-box-containing protein
MSDSAFPWRLLSEPALAVHATSALPAWLWSMDGRRLIFANPTGAAILGADTCAAAAGREFEAGHSAAAQIAGIAESLPASGAPRLQRLRGFGAGFGRTLTCLCRQVTHEDMPAVLVTAIETAGPRLTLAERVRRLFDGSEGRPIAVYSMQNGLLDELLFATPGGEARLSGPFAVSTADLAGNIDRLGEGENEVRILRLPEASIAAPATADATGEPDATEDAAAETIDLSRIADAIGEAQKAMAVERAAQDQASDDAEAVTPDAATAEVAVHPAAAERRHPMRFVWTIDAENRFCIERGDFIDLIGPKTAAELNRPWVSITADLDLDRDGEVTRAIASRDTWSGISIDWPVDDSDERIAVELAGLPVYDRDRKFRGYRGFGVCRDLARASALLAARKGEGAPDAASQAESGRPALSLVTAAENVVPFRLLTNDNNKTSLNPVEQNAFQELASRLTARLKGADEVARGETLPGEDEPATETQFRAVAAAEPDVFPTPAQAAAAESVKHDRPLLDLLPAGILIYRHEHFHYANRAFLRWCGYDNVQDFAEAGGLDTLFIEPQADGERTLRIAAPGGAQPPVTGHLLSIPWNGSTAMMLVTTDATQGDQPAQPAAKAGDVTKTLEIATDGVVTFGRDGTILTANAGAERLFGYDRGQLSGLPFTNLFAGDSAAMLRQALLAGAAADKQDVTARTRRGETLPLQMSLGTIDEAAGTICAAFQNLSRWKATERELVAARKQAEAASAAKSDFLARVSHEIRTPLNAIIGFSDVMMNERFGPVGNERYKEYLKDIHNSGTHLVSLVNDLLDLSKIEAGRLDLSFEPVNLNDLTQQTVALMQPEASRERIIIRTSLAPELPAVVADARSVKQIVLNLLSNSIKFTDAGGQVILSTARTDHGEAVLRVRDTGVGMSEKDIRTALEPFRQLSTAARPDSHGTGLGLPLTKALVEANSARFSIKSAVNAGTLVEIVFPAVRAAE